MRNTINQLFKAAERDGVGFYIMSMEESNLVLYEGMSAKKAYDATREEGGAQCYLRKDGMEEWVFALHCNDPDESVSDCTAYGFVDKWCEASDFGQVDTDYTWEQGRENFYETKNLRRVMG